MGVKVPPRGTHGVEIPALRTGAVTGWSRRQQSSFRKDGGGRTQGGLHTLLLETIGAKSGAPRVAMVGYVEEAPGSMLIIGSMSGAAHHPAWVHNLAKQPWATVEFGGGRRVAVEAETLSGDEADQAWELIGREAAEYPAYRSQTDRELPVIRLRERPPAPDSPRSLPPRPAGAR